MRPHRLFSGLRSLFARHRAEADIDDELASHIEFQARKHIAAGMTGEEARRRARIELGGLQQTREQVRDVDRWRWLDVLSRNFKYALRSLSRSPAFSLTAILILAVGIGSNLTIFTLLDVLLFRPLPVDHPEQLLDVSVLDKSGAFAFTPSTMVEPMKTVPGLESVCGFNTSRQGAKLNGELRSISVMGITGDCFRAIGVGVQLGRRLVPEDDTPGAPGAAVISAPLWRGVYGGRPDVLGKPIQIAGVALTIVGVAEESFQGLVLGDATGVILPLDKEPSPLPGATIAFHPITLIARRAPGEAFARLAAAIQTRTSALLEASVPRSFTLARRKRYLDYKLEVVSCVNGIDYSLRSRFGTPLYAILGICATILVVACVNLANLLIARSLRRRKEFVMRLALGSRRLHIAGLLAFESAIVVIPGAGLGLIFAEWADRAIFSRGAALFGVFTIQPGFDARTSIFFAAVVCFIAAVFVVASALQAGLAGRDYELARQSGRGVIATAGRGQRVLLTAQIALTLVLVAVSSMFGTSLRKLYSIDLGIRTGNTWGVELAARPGGYNNAAPGAYLSDLLDRIRALPGVTAASITNIAPLHIAAPSTTVAAIDGAASGREFEAKVLSVTDGFFHTLGVSIIAGRDVGRADQNGEVTAVVSRAFAEQLNGLASVIGHHIRVGPSPIYGRIKIVGIVNDARLDLEEPARHRQPIVYVNVWSVPRFLARNPVLVIKTQGLVIETADLRRVVDSQGVNYVDRVASLDAEKDAALVENRVVAYLSGAFGVLALVLAATGLFGLLSYQVASRTNEIGLRLALGARSRQIRWYVIRQILAIVAIGSAAGLALSLAAGRVIGGLLFGVSGSDPFLLVSSVAGLGMTAMLAAWLPSRRAAFVDPAVALRHE